MHSDLLKTILDLMCGMEKMALTELQTQFAQYCSVGEYLALLVCCRSACSTITCTKANDSTKQGAAQACPTRADTPTTYRL